MSQVPQQMQKDFTNPASKMADALGPIVVPYKADLAAVNRLIEEKYQNAVPLMQSVGTHHFQSGGKRVRPLLTLIFAHVLEANKDQAAHLAACVELIHAASLLHDDVLDESEQRRGQPSINAMWGNRVSILAGDFLFSQAFSCMVDVGVQDVYKILSWASATITEGELHQISVQRDLSINLTEYEQVIEKKTASLFQAAAELPGCLVKISAEEKKALAQFGRSFGRIFQLMDDYLDYMGQEDALGKRLGADLREGKVTFPVLVAYQQGTPAEKAFWTQLFREDTVLKAIDQEQVKALILKYQVKRLLTQYIDNDFKSASEALAVFPASAHTQALSGLLNYLRDRSS